MAIPSLLQSCREDPNIPPCELDPGQCYRVEEIKDFFYFQPGSYWVYEEETSGELDSTYVTYSEEDPASYYFNIYVYSNRDEYYYHYWPKKVSEYLPDSGLTTKTGYSTIIKMSKTKPGDFVSENYIFKYWVDKGDSLPIGSATCYNNVIHFTNLYPTLEIEGNQFENVYELDEQCTGSEHYQRTVKYYAKYHGLVKKVLVDSNEVWNLVRYSHIQ